jgi:hypothetical protein
MPWVHLADSLLPKREGREKSNEKKMTYGKKNPTYHSLGLTQVPDLKSEGNQLQDRG